MSTSFKSNKRRRNTKKRDGSSLDALESVDNTVAKNESKDEKLDSLTISAFKKPRHATKTKSTTQSTVLDTDNYKSSGNASVTESDSAVVLVEKDGPRTDPNKLSKVQGPMKVANNVRIQTQFDFAPMICKDYKQSGYCSYGDTCLYRHDRGNDKTGWQLEKEYEEALLKKKRREEDPDYVSDDEKEVDNILDNLPFCCIICTKFFTKPVVTKCNHYFCEKCALKRFQKNTRCATCGENTNGVFNTANIIVDNEEALKKKKKDVQEANEESIESGASVADASGNNNKLYKHKKVYH